MNKKGGVENGSGWGEAGVEGLGLERCGYRVGKTKPG